MMHPAQINSAELDTLQILKARSLSGKTNEQILSGLLTLKAEATALGCPEGQSPAIVTDLNNQVLSVDSSGVAVDPLRIPLVRALTQVTQSMDSLPAGTLPVKVFVLGNDNKFDGVGAVNSFAPAQVIVLEDSSVQCLINPGNADYLSALKEQRGTDVSFIGSLSEPETKFAASGVDLSSCSFPAEFKPRASVALDPQLAEITEIYSHFVQAFKVMAAKDDTDLRATKEMLKYIHQLAGISVRRGGGPFAALVLSPEGGFVSVGTNRVVPQQDPLMHGEVSAMQRALSSLRRSDLQGYRIITSSEPCIACSEAAARVGITEIDFGNSRTIVESETEFTEGPMLSNFLTQSGIISYQVPNMTNRDALRLFTKRTIANPEASYLKRLS